MSEPVLGAGDTEQPKIDIFFKFTLVEGFGQAEKQSDGSYLGGAQGEGT